MILAAEPDVINLIPPWPMDKYTRAWTMTPALDPQNPYADSDFSDGLSTFSVRMLDSNRTITSFKIYRDDFGIRTAGTLATTLTLIYRHTVPGVHTTVTESILTDKGLMTRTEITDTEEDDGKIKRTAVFEYAGKISWIQISIAAYYGSGDAVDISDMGLYRGIVVSSYDPAPPHVAINSRMRVLGKQLSDITCPVTSWVDDLPIVYSGRGQFVGASVDVINLLDTVIIKPHPGMLYRIVFDDTAAPYAENIAVDRIVSMEYWNDDTPTYWIKTTSTSQGPTAVFRIDIFECTYIGTDDFASSSMDRDWDDGHTHLVGAAAVDNVVVAKWATAAVGLLTRSPLQMIDIMQYTDSERYRLLVENNSGITYWWQIDTMPQSMFGAVFDPNLPRSFFNAQDQNGVERSSLLPGNQSVSYFWRVVPSAADDSGYYLDVAYPTPPYSAFRLIRPALRKYDNLAELLIL